MTDNETTDGLSMLWLLKDVWIWLWLCGYMVVWLQDTFANCDYDAI